MYRSIKNQAKKIIVFILLVGLCFSPYLGLIKPVLADGPLTVTIDQSPDQIDPVAPGAPVKFRAVFSNPINVSTFTAADIDSSQSTAPDVTITDISEVTPNDGTTFDITVTTSGVGGVVLNVIGAGSSSILGTTGASPNGVTVDSSGNVYTANYNSDNVTKITPEGVSAILGITESNPVAITVDPAGNVYTANQFSHNVTKITPDGTPSIFGTTGLYPQSIVIDPAGNIYTANINTEDVSKITSLGASSILGDAGIQPIGITIDTDGNIYTANYGGNNVSKITPLGVPSILGAAGANPQGIAIDTLGNIYTANFSGNNVSKITPLGASSIIGTAGTSPQAITLDSAGNIYTANIGSDNVTKITPEGVSSILGTTGSSPAAITIDALGNIYTANSGSNNVSKIKTQGGIEDLSGITNNVSTSTDNSVTIALPPLDVTINQSPDQADPVIIGASVKFRVVFSQAINIETFTTADINTSESTASGVAVTNIVEVAPNDGTTFDITVTASGTGRVNAYINEGVVEDLVGTTNNASSSEDDTVTINPVPLAVVINQSPDQVDPATIGSPIKFRVVFSEAIDRSTFTAADIDTSESTATGVVVTSIVEVSPHDGTTFDITVTTTGLGNVILKIPGGVDPYSSNKIYESVLSPNMMVMDTFGNIYTVNSQSNNVSKITPQGVATILGVTGNSPFGIAIDSDNNIYTTNQNDSTISKITPAGVSTVFTEIGLCLRGVIADSENNIYVADGCNNAVLKIAPNGDLVDTYVVGNGPESLRLNGGNLYVTNSDDDTISKITPAGTVSNAGSTGAYPRNMVFDAAGNIYTTDYYDNTVTKITPEGSSSIFAHVGTYPNGIAIDADENIYVTNEDDNTVSKVTPEGVVSLFGQTGATPKGILIDATGNIYTANSSSNNISKITLQGNSSIFSILGYYHHDMALDSAGNIYTIDPDVNSVFKMSTTGVVTNITNTISCPDGIYIDGNNNIFIANKCNDTISKINSAGEASVFASLSAGSAPHDIIPDSTGNIYTIVSSGEGPDQVVKISSGGTVNDPISVGAGAKYLAVDSHNNIYVTNAGDATVSVIDANSISSRVLGSTGVSPRGIVVDSLGNVYTADNSDNTITKITPAGSSSVFAELGYCPNKITIDGFDNLYVTNGCSGIVVKIVPDGTARVIADVGSYPYGITLDAAGNIYTANYDDGSISKITVAGITSYNGSVSNTTNSTSEDNSITVIAASTGGGGSRVDPIPDGIGDGKRNVKVPMGQAGDIGSLDSDGVNLLSFTGSSASLYTLVSNDGRESHRLTLDSLDINSGLLSFTFYSDPQTLTLKPGESINVDLNKDNIKDISVKFASLLVNRIELTIKSLFGSISPTNNNPKTDIVSLIDQEANLILGQANPLNYFINIGTPTTLKLGSGERAAAISSYKEAYNKAPKTKTDWIDVLNIANGRWPITVIKTVEARAYTNFKLVYGRNANMKNSTDVNALKMMGYGVRSTQLRNLALEKQAIIKFKTIFKFNPTTARHWNIMRAIGYSGVVK